MSQIIVRHVIFDIQKKREHFAFNAVLVLELHQEEQVKTGKTIADSKLNKS